jgi:mono/diheme cytochrome c family protein
MLAFNAGTNFTLAQNGESNPKDPQANNQLYAEKIRPLLDKHCTQCHGSEEQGGGLKLDSIASMTLGGDSGTAIKPNDAAASLLWQRVSSVNPDERMPPEGAGLSAA